jgi:monoamine oxidase
VGELLTAHGWSAGEIELFGLLFDQEAELDASCLELLREELGGYYEDLVSLGGGMDTLPRAYLPALEGRVRLGCRVVALEQSPTAVTLHLRTARGLEHVQGDAAILTLPFPALRHVDILTPFSCAKQQAIRQLRYDAATKIYLHCRRRFWEEDDGIVGGGSVTDLPVRHIYYPEHGRETGQGLLLASYTWGQDADVWGALPPEERVARALVNVSQLHPQAGDACVGGLSKVWRHDEFAGGAFAAFNPGQYGRLHTASQAPEGRVHFAGEHTSLDHGWIQGAIVAGLRAAREVHTRGV